ncbi:MAG: hypothetical protein JW751_29610 [Polyangiaceae bacterium]|nr:hypothetical protein [Polyangiaceae bacterium]
MSRVGGHGRPSAVWEERLRAGFISVVLVACGGKVATDAPGLGGASGNGAAPEGIGGAVPSTGGVPAADSDGGPRPAANCPEPRPITQAEHDQYKNSACVGWAAESDPILLACELVVMVDRTMESPFADPRTSRWAATRRAIVDAVARHPAVDIGAVLAPNLAPTGAVPSVDAQPSSACVAESGVFPLTASLGADVNGRERFEALLSAVEPSPGRPLESAYARGLGAVAAQLGEIAILVVTDGPPTLAAGCRNPTGELAPVSMDPFLQAITNAANLGVRTHVIGLPGSEDVATDLSRAALLGGTAVEGCNAALPDGCHHEPTTEDELRAALDLVLGPGPTNPICRLDLPPPPAGEELDLATVEYFLMSGAEYFEVAADETGSCDNGWRFEGSQIVLEEQLCSQLLASKWLRPEVLIGCDIGLFR